jgi:hypothetical protein
MSDKIKLGIFCPSSFNDYPFLRDLLNKKVDSIGLIVSNGCGYELPERFARENNIATLTYPIGKNLNCLKANDLILRASDHILIIENGQSQNNETVIKKCKVAEKPFKVIDAPETSQYEITIDELSKIGQAFKESGEEFLGQWLEAHKKWENKMRGIFEKL